MKKQVLESLQFSYMYSICTSGRAKFKRGQGAFCQYEGTLFAKFCFEDTDSAICAFERALFGYFQPFPLI